MRKIALLVALTVTVVGVVALGHTRTADAQTQTPPYYFVAIHCEPTGEDEIARNFVVLREMVAYADAYNVKLTIMFTPQWADYVSADPDRLAEVQGWMENGHEIAAHHHSIYHGTWDGYTDFPQEVVREQVRKPRPYLGTLDDYIAALRRVNPDIQAGCVNDEQDKRVMPDAIIYDTCSGFSNAGAPGERNGDNTPEKGVNRFVTVGTVNGIQRKWLTHYQVYHQPQAAFRAMMSMDGGAYGVVTHAAAGQDAPLYAFLDAVHEVDPEGALSRTVSAIIEEALLPEVELPDEVVNAVYESTRPPQSAQNGGMGGGKCGDGVCDPFEREHPGACPQDCPQATGTP